MPQNYSFGNDLPQDFLTILYLCYTLYLVAFEISDETMDEMKRLNRAFGIGVIKLDPDLNDQSELFPARKNELDYYTIDKLCRINTEFKEFINKTVKVITAQADVLEDVRGGLLMYCDKGLDSEDEIIAYCNENHIPW